MSELLANRPLMAVLTAWALAQSLKVAIDSAIKRRFDITMWASAGGMPSTHAASVTALTAALVLQEGLGSPIVGLAIAFAAVVLFDAAGVRQAAMNQARVLNSIVEELFQDHQLSQSRLRDLIGHTPFEVVVGALLGIAIGVVWVTWP
jgi:hypothetical protein